MKKPSMHWRATEGLIFYSFWMNKSIKAAPALQANLEGDYQLVGRKLIPRFNSSFKLLVIKPIPKDKQRVSYCNKDINFINEGGGAEYISGLFNTLKPNVFSLDLEGIKYLLEISADSEGGEVATIKYNGLKRRRS
jgi:hypothetical protein